VQLPVHLNMDDMNTVEINAKEAESSVGTSYKTIPTS
jgi:hypothetical protein